MIPSPNYSSRGGVQVKYVVIHTAEGARDVESLGNYFSRTSVQASSHVGIDDHRIESYVDLDNAAWTIRSCNVMSDNAELCGFAAWTRNQWLTEHHGMLSLAAQWIRERCQARGIPIIKCSPADVAAGRPGVIGHVDWTIGARDGSHTDPGDGFPWDVVIQLARAGAPAPTDPEDLFMALSPQDQAVILEAARSVLFGRPGVRWDGELAGYLRRIERYVAPATVAGLDAPAEPPADEGFAMHPDDVRAVAVEVARLLGVQPPS